LIEMLRTLVDPRKRRGVRHPLVTVKDNQPTLKQDMADLHLEAFPPSAHHRG
jgi:hypothetical protein